MMVGAWEIAFGFESARRGPNGNASSSRGLVHREHFAFEALARFAFDTWKANPPCQCDWIALVEGPSSYNANDAKLRETHVFPRRAEHSSGEPSGNPGGSR